MEKFQGIRITIVMRREEAITGGPLPRERSLLAFPLVTGSRPRKLALC